ncbi:hypothetical protein BBP40_009421 [Aspergillus hancockii]|nr:hypothetical protein BBP40_009421 [Aspergillus hancockii]
MKGLQNGIPLAVLAAVARAQVTVVGGPGGIDRGNDAALGFSNEVYKEVNTANIDDHSTDINTDTNIFAPPPPPPGHGPPHGEHHGHDGGRHERRGKVGDDGAAGSSGDDVGNASAWGDLKKAKGKAGGDYHAPPSTNVLGGPGSKDLGNGAAGADVNEAKKKVHAANVDDHHVSIDQKEDITVLPPPPPPRPHHGGHHMGHGSEGHGDENDEGHHEERRGLSPESVTLVAGPGGIDRGNDAALGFSNEVYKEVNTANIDDHSFDFDEDTTIVAPPPHPHGHGPNRPAHGRRGDTKPDVTVVGGPHGVDIGNEADLAFKNDYDSEVNTYNKDNHGVDINTDTHIAAVPPPPGPPDGFDGQHERRSENPDVTVVGGPGGVDVGNAAAVNFENEYKSEVTTLNKDDDSVDINTDTNIVPVPPSLGPSDEFDGQHERRSENPDVTLVGGPGGVDVGNAAAADFENEYKSKVTTFNKDDHSVDINKDTHIVALPPPPHHGPPHGFGGHHERRGERPDVTVVGGPGGVDVGNTAASAFENRYKANVNTYNEDDHSVNINHETDIKFIPPPPHGPPHHDFHPGRERRNHGADVTMVGGPGGVDVGNAAAYAQKNEYDSKVSTYNKDDHGVDINHETDIKFLPPHPPHHGHGHGSDEDHFKRTYAPDTTLTGGPGGVDVGNTYAQAQSNTAGIDVNAANKDDHSLKYSSQVHQTVTAPYYGGYDYGHDEHEGKHNDKPYNKPVESHEQKHDDQHEEKPEHQPEVKHEGQHEQKPEHDGQHEQKPEHDGQHEQKPEHDGQHEQKPEHDGQHEQKPEHDGQHEQKPEHDGQHEQKPEHDGQHEQKPEHDGQHEQKPEHDGQHEEKPEHNGQHEEKPEPKHEDNYEEKPANKPEGKSDDKDGKEPEAKQDDKHGNEQDNHAKPAPTCSTLTHQVVHTVTRTLSDHPTQSTSYAQPKDDVKEPTHEAEDEDDDEDDAEPSPSGGTANHAPGVNHVPVPSHAPAASHAPEASHAVNGPQPTGSKPGYVAPSGHAAPSVGNAAPASTEAAYPAWSSNAFEPNPSHDGANFDVPSSTALAHVASTNTAHGTSNSFHDSNFAHAPTSAPNAHMVVTSTLTVAHASSFHMIPVYVPLSSSTAAAHTPVGVDDKRSSRSRPTPSASPSHDAMFRGAAANLSPSAGVISLICGVMGLLAYVL